MEVVVRPRLLIKVLPRESEVHRDGALALDDPCCPKGFCLRLPAYLSFFGGRQLRRAQMIRVQMVIDGVAVGQAGVVDVGLPDRIGAP